MTRAVRPNEADAVWMPVARGEARTDEAANNRTALTVAARMRAAEEMRGVAPTALRVLVRTVARTATRGEAAALRTIRAVDVLRALPDTDALRLVATATVVVVSAPTADETNDADAVLYDVARAVATAVDTAYCVAAAPETGPNQLPNHRPNHEPFHPATVYLNSGRVW